MERPALRWSIAMTLYRSASWVIGFHGVCSQNDAAERIPPGAISSSGKPSPWSS